MLKLEKFWANQNSLVMQTVKNLPAVQETWVWPLDREDPLEKGTATHSSTLAWRIPRVDCGVANSWTRLSDQRFHFTFWTNQKDLITQSVTHILLSCPGVLASFFLVICHRHREAHCSHCRVRAEYGELEANGASVRNSIIHNHPKVEAVQKFVICWMDK